MESLTAIAADAVVWAAETYVSPRTWWLHGDEDVAPRRYAEGRLGAGTALRVRRVRHLAQTMVRPVPLLRLEQGGVYAVANIRGGGEYGEAWHHAGRLAIMGGSNGGLLMGAVLTQRPDIAKAVVCAVPVLDPLRVELTPNGACNVTEFGTVADPELFRAMLAYSPYHNVHDGTTARRILPCSSPPASSTRASTPGTPRR